MKKNKIELSSAENPEILKSEFKINLFQNDLMDSNLDLYLYFPNQRQYIQESNFFNIIISAVFFSNWIVFLLCDSKSVRLEKIIGD